MFGRGLNIGIGLGLIFFSPAVFLIESMLREIENNTSNIGSLFFLGFWLLCFLINGIGLILKKKWSLITSTNL
jgi:hypothetical protein